MNHWVLYCFQSDLKGWKESRLLLLWDIPSNHSSFFMPPANCTPIGDNYPDRKSGIGTVKHPQSSAEVGLCGRRVREGRYMRD